jgi:hypothetical protein
MTVLFLYRASLLRYLTMMYEVKESNPEVGSSRKSTCGSEMSSTAIEALFF